MIKTMNLRAIIVVLATCILASIFFGLLYHFDNKYNTAAEISQDGSILLSDYQNKHKAGSENITWLVKGWEFYPGKLIYPGDHMSGSQSIYIGQYFSFAGFNENGSPYGTGTYRLKLHGDGNYTMFIPEIFSACTVYADGRQIISSGSINPYESEIKDLVFSFEISGETEILIQTANYSHYYSGMTYPPAIGSSQAINRLVSIRMLFYGFLVFTSLALALFAAVIWCGTRKNRTSGEDFWLGILGLSFSIEVCYPFIHMLGISFGNAAYVLENTMAALGLFCIVRTVSLICLETDSLPERVLKGIAGGFVLIGLIFSLWMAEYLPGFAPVYGQILYWYKALTAVIMILVMLRHFGKVKSGQALILLAGLMVYFLSLIFHALYLGRFEPVYTGWFEEWGTYILIICFACRMALKNLEIIRENRHLNSHLQEEVRHKTESLTKLLEERRMILSGFAHDLKTPITSITTFTRLVELDNTQLDEESRQYLDIIRRKTKEIQEQLSTINEFTQIDSTPPTFEPLDLCGLLRDFYKGNKPDINVSGVSFDLSIKGSQPIMILGDSRKLVSVLQNLVFNAVDFTPEGGNIFLCLCKEQDSAVIRVKDTGSGISEEDIPHIFDRLFTNRENEKNRGMGLFIVKTVITEHGGTIEAASASGKGTVFTIRLPVIKQDI